MSEWLSILRPVLAHFVSVRRAGVEMWSKELAGHAFATHQQQPQQESSAYRPPLGSEIFDTSFDETRLKFLRSAIRRLHPDKELNREQQQAAQMQEIDDLTLHWMYQQELRDNDEPIVPVESFDKVVRMQRAVHQLHFLVDGAPGAFWHTCITIDAQRPPALHEILDRATVSLELPWSNLRALFGLPPFVGV